MSCALGTLLSTWSGCIHHPGGDIVSPGGDILVPSAGHGRAGAVPHHYHGLLPRRHGLHPDVRHHQRGVLQRRAGLVSAHGALGDLPKTIPALFPPTIIPSSLSPKGPPRSRPTRGTTPRSCWWGTSVTWRTSASSPRRRAASSPSTWVSRGGLCLPTNNLIRGLIPWL